MKGYRVLSRKVVCNGDIHLGTAPKFEYVVDDRYGVFETRNAAKAAYITDHDPELIGSNEIHLVMHFDQMARNLKYAKVEKVL